MNKIDAILLKETRDLVDKWNASTLFSTSSVPPVILESVSTLIIDGCRIDYKTEEEKKEKLKDYIDYIESLL